MKLSNMNRLLFSLALLAACRDVSAVGEDFIESTNYELALNNSIPLEFSTIRYDSLVTSGLDRLVVGGQQGSGFGDFEVVSYFLVDLTGSEFEFRDNLVYDSITLSVVYQIIPELELGRRDRSGDTGGRAVGQ